MNSSKEQKKTGVEVAFDLLCILSLVGIWPRFIEPNLLFIRRIKVPVPNLPQGLQGLKVLHFADLHFNRTTSPWFIKRLLKKISSLSPDLILFSGDFLSFSKLYQEDLATFFLDHLKAPLGLFFCLGNHDYAYCLEELQSAYFNENPQISSLCRGMLRLFGHESKTHLNGPIPLNKDLLKLYEDHGVTLLHNETVHVGYGKERLNLTGLGDLSSLHLDPEAAFKGFDYNVPGIVLSHDPDSFEILRRYPGDLLLFGHTHGAQVNLPFIWKKIAPLRDKSLKSGLKFRDGKTLYISRGVGATLPFRLFAPPDIALFELERDGRVAEKVLLPFEAALRAQSASLATSYDMLKQ